MPAATSSSSTDSSPKPVDVVGAGKGPDEERAPEQPGNEGDKPSALCAGTELPPEDLDDESDDEDNGQPAGTSKKGWARGARENKILKKHIEPYRQARQMGTRDAEDYLQMVVNEYCYRILYNLPDDEEPPLPLREWTPTTPPDDDTYLSKKERKKKAAWIIYMIPRIKHWLDYRAQGGTHATPATGKKLDPTDPINIMLFQIADTLPAHRARQGWQQFWHEKGQTTVENEVVRRWPDSAERKVALEKRRVKEALKKGKGKGTGKAVDPKPTGPFRQTTACTLFAKMSKADQQPYLERAAAEKAAINNLVPTIGRFMKGVAELTNMHIVMALGGPSPRFHGTLHTVHYSAGENNAPSPVAFPDWDAQHFNTHTLEKMKLYLRTAYSPEECMASALPEHMCIGSREDAWASLRQGPGPSPNLPAPNSPAPNLDDAGLIRMSPAPETGDKRKKQSKGKKRKTAASSGESGESESDDAGKEDESGDESEGETGGKRKHGAVSSSRNEKTGETGPKSSAAAGPRMGIISGKPRPRPYTKRDIPASTPGNAGPSTVPVLTGAVGAEAVAMGDEPGGVSQPASEESSQPVAEERRRDEASPLPPPEDVDAEMEKEGDGEGDGQLVDGPELPMTCPPDASEWLKELWPEIAGENVTPSYRALLEAFVAFERGQGWLDGEKALSASGRPKQVKDWIRADRKATPRLTKLHKRYEEEFWIWWKMLQPQWRKVKTEWAAMDAVQKGGEGESWVALTVPGKNGLVSIVASLYWWGREGVVGDSVSPAWLNAVKDITWALRRMASSASDSQTTS
ncbi:hypothetical protein C8F01DRAFT_1093446 [Mycena amicta]|nr:hypothetical protein C8F01DRAFT_1093446 [Mycena amicta]